MKDYLVVYKNGESETITISGKKELIQVFFNGDEQQFRERVSLLKWNTLSTYYTEDVQKGSVNAHIDTADVNPYGWRV